MAEITYVVHPGNGKMSPGEPDQYIDAGTLASLYGLLPGEYFLDDNKVYDEQWEFRQIHLHPRLDGKYQSIKKLLGDNGTNKMIDYAVGYKKHRQKRFNKIL